MTLNESTKNSSSIPGYRIFIFIFIICLIFIGYQFISRSSPVTNTSRAYNLSSWYIPSSNESKLTNEATSTTRTLIIYVYANSHTLAEQNLLFFIRTAVHQSHDADYYFILQQVHQVPVDESKLPSLPSNAHYVQHENRCFDIGTIGWFLSSNITDKTKYKYFIFLNSSVRGPFIVSYYDNPVWYTIFTRRLNAHIKLVGCTINCETSPHVQSYLWTLDIQGLNLLLKDGMLFVCFENKNDAINTAEIGASRIILRAGYGIDCLMKKHQNIDFRLAENQRCNNGGIPTFNKGVDGISLDPFEVVFVKIKDRMVEYQDNRERVLAYEKWIH